MAKTIHRGLRDVKIAAWNSIGSYGTAVDLLGAQEFTVKFDVETDELRGDDVRLDQYSKIIGLSASVKYATVDLTAMALMVGGTVVSNTEYENLRVGEVATPYFVIAGRVVGTDESVDLHMISYKCRIAGEVGYEASEGSYLLPSVEISGFDEGTGGSGVADIRNFVGPTGLTIPLATAVD